MDLYEHGIIRHSAPWRCDVKTNDEGEKVSLVDRASETRTGLIAAGIGGIILGFCVQRWWPVGGGGFLGLPLSIEQTLMVAGCATVVVGLVIGQKTHVCDIRRRSDVSFVPREIGRRSSERVMTSSLEIRVHATEMYDDVQMSPIAGHWFVGLWSGGVLRFALAYLRTPEEASQFATEIGGKIGISKIEPGAVLTSRQVTM